MTKYLIGFIALLCPALYVSLWQYYKVNEKWEIAEANVKAYNEELSFAKGKTTALQLTVSQLEYFNDSILKQMNEVREELKVKDKNLKALQYVSSSFSKTDTITLKDTLFREPSFSLDTLIGDEWYTLALELKYPSTITVNPKFNSEKYIVVSSKKETVNPPKKFFLFRLFQRKHVVLKVNVVEKNPYIENTNSKYVEILQ